MTTPGILTRQPAIEVIADGGSFTVPAGWKNVFINPAAGATVTINNGVSILTINIPMIFGGMENRKSEFEWGQLTISTFGGSCGLIINGGI